jgi:FkbM family methyltransferase
MLKALRMIPSGLPGKRRLANLLYRPTQAGPTFVDGRGGWRFEVPDAREPVAFGLAVDGVYETEILSLLKEQVPAGGVLVDVGANIGAISVPLAKHVGSAGRVLAIEASPDVFPYLVRNVALNGLTNVTCVEAAVVERPGDVPFFAPPAEHFGMGSLAPQFYVSPVTVRGLTLDQLLAEANISTVDVLKIDVEGAERGVLQGAEGLLRGPQPPLVVFEFCDWAETRIVGQAAGDAQRLLQNWGYEIWEDHQFRQRKPPLREPRLSGAANIVARRCH